MATLSCGLTEDQRRQIDAALAGLTGIERHRERERLRSKALREDPAYRLADNARKAQHGRRAYRANPEAARAGPRRRRGGGGLSELCSRRPLAVKRLDDLLDHVRGQIPIKANDKRIFVANILEAVAGKTNSDWHTMKRS